MESRAIVAAVLLVGALVPATFAMTGDGAAPRQQSAIVKFEHPTWVANEILIGTYVIVHDADNMARGKPCTALYRAAMPARLLEEVVSFHCMPHERKVVHSFTITVDRNPSLDNDTLTEFQFTGDSEGHGVPITALVSGRLRVPQSTVCVR